MSFFRLHRAWIAFLAISCLCFAVSFFARRRANATAAGFFRFWGFNLAMLKLYHKGPFMRK